jgi:hypothetical protein
MPSARKVMFIDFYDLWKYFLLIMESRFENVKTKNEMKKPLCLFAFLIAKWLKM